MGPTKRKEHSSDSLTKTLKKRLAESVSSEGQDRVLRAGTMADIDALVDLEQACFSHDRLSRRQFVWMLKRANAELHVAIDGLRLLGYVLVLFHRGTSLARLYSIAVSHEAQSTGLGRQLLLEAEQLALARDCIYLRLEVEPQNAKAISLYERLGYRSFGIIDDYYQNHSDALRYEKRIVPAPAPEALQVPFYEQTLDFTCGPACLIMAMKALQPSIECSRSLEVQLWREATTIYMTSGHGGCSPQGLALAAVRRGFDLSLRVNQTGPLFLDGVRKLDKKAVLSLVHDDFISDLEALGIHQIESSFDTKTLIDELSAGHVPLVLISSWRFNASKAPHWVVLAAADSRFVYIHDPDVDTKRHKVPGDTQFVPVRHVDFDRMIFFGQSRAQAALCLTKATHLI